MTDVVRLNEAEYERGGFVARGIAHHDLAFDDCSAPPDRVVRAFFAVADAAEGARFGLPEAGLGIIPGLGGTQLLTRAVGPRRALELLTTAAPFTADQAMESGLVSGVVAPEALMETVLAVAAQIASRAPLSVRGLKRVVHGGLDLDLKQAMDLELTVYNHLFTTHDRREGVASFNEKRTPALPDTPTLIEQGIPDFELMTWTGILMPRGVPQPAMAKLREAMLKAITDPAYVERQAQGGSEIAPCSPDEMRRIMVAEIELYREMMKVAGIEPE